MNAENDTCTITTNLLISVIILLYDMHAFVIFQRRYARNDQNDEIDSRHHHMYTQ